MNNLPEELKTELRAEAFWAGDVGELVLTLEIVEEIILRVLEENT